MATRARTLQGLCAALLLGGSGGLWLHGRKAGATVEIAGGTTFRFGSVARGARLEHTFRLYNPHSYAVRLTIPKQDCGCSLVALTATPDAPAIPPRGAVGVKVVGVAGGNGDRAESIKVVTGDAKQNAAIWLFLEYRTLGAH